MFFFFRKIRNQIQQRKNRKEGKILPARNQKETVRERTFLPAFIQGSLTIETAVVLPLFLFAMLTMLQFASIQISTSALLAGMQDTAKEMAAYAYIQNMGLADSSSAGAQLIRGGISLAYADSSVREKAGAALQNGTFTMLPSGFFQQEMIDLKGIYYAPGAFRLLPVRRVKTLMRARVRAWTGRKGSSGEGTGQDKTAEEEQEEKVYVAENGTVYHKDPNCTHIRLSIENVSRSEVKNRRNNSGGKYHACERCGAGTGDTVYISPEGNKYHSSLSCSGLKRTVEEKNRSDLSGMRACSKCGGDG